MSAYRHKNIKWPPAPPPRDVWELCLYVAGHNRKSASAFENISSICEEHLAGRFHLEVFDILKDPRIARRDQIIMTPTLVKKSPEPRRIVYGNFSRPELVLVGLDVE